jgi:hypothetical protein
MKFSGLPLVTGMFRCKLGHWRVSALLVCVLASSNLRAQEAGDVNVPDKQTLQLLLSRIDQLEARVKQLEAERQPAVHASPELAPIATQTSAPPATETEPHQTPGAEPDRMDLSETLLRMRGFGDVTLHGGNQRGETTGFGLGQLNLFVTSDVSERFKFLSEIVFEAGPLQGLATNSFGVDVERYLLQYSYNDHFNLAVGRYHTAIGYYNTAYHHSTWFQTTTGRPFLFAFEDQGGILPIHNVGVSASGLLPSGRLGLHYVAEIGNGRSSRSPLSDEPVQNKVDENSHKAFNLAVFARPQAVSGLQVGFSFYRDLLTPVGAPKIGENILAAHGVFARSGYEWLNEAVLIRHAPQGSGTVFNTPGFYTQIARRFGPYQPYFRYQYVNAGRMEPVFPDVGLRQGPSIGLRYDASDAVALKLQYDYSTLRGQPGVNGLALQLGFTF